jgi:hypothetical protein
VPAPVMDVPAPVSPGGNVPVNPTAPGAPADTVGVGEDLAGADDARGAPVPAPDPGVFGAGDDEEGPGDGAGEAGSDGATTATFAEAPGGVHGSSVGTLAVALRVTEVPAPPAGTCAVS